MIKPTINPETLLIDGLSGATFSAADFARIQPPDCPVCGTPVSVDRIDITWNAEEEARQGRTYIAGRWECPHHCDPVTMTRRHYGQQFRTGPGFLGTECICSCGDTTMVISEAEGQAWQAMHHPPER